MFLRDLSVVLLLHRFGILLDKKDSIVLVLPFTEEQIVVPWYMMSTS
ncbi:hypothetical protein AALP_AA8G281000 [Arabis alpina]|uniref:Uncharacterized protein n=1 Tax=Arabis alpina TaxID=50452 RepID=A0A087G9Z0_ARAAL|nr:hypothetical protein AALP_AA8G281000 [Arabis alpina]